MSHRTLTKALALAATLAAALVTTMAATSPANAATTEEQLAGKRYVALGDSYAAGFGLPPYSATPAAGCAQSADSIARRIADSAALDLTDVSCTGATIANVVSIPQTVPGATVPVQLDAVSSDTALVTLTIGGNDAGFSTVLPGCAAASPAGPLLQDPASPSCAAKYGNQLGAAIQGAVAPALDAVLAGIRLKAPDAKIVLLGYPALAPTDANTPGGGCFSSALGTGQPPLPENAFPFTDADRPFIASLSAQLDAVQAAAAQRNGVTFVSVLDETDAHTPCAATATPYLNGITLQSIAPPTLAAGALHPNSAGAAFLAGRLHAAIAQLFPPTTDPAPTAPVASPTGGAAATPSTSATGSTAQLAATGAEALPAALLGVVALLLGGALLVVRRRSTDT